LKRKRNYKKENGFKTPFKPVLQVIYLVFSSAVMIYLVWDRPWESFAGMGILGLGLLLFLFDKKIEES
jgi:APA family basic amino acid/polyamine antiporter